MGSYLTEMVFETYSARPTVALLMSGEGSNAAAILADPELQELYDITTIVTDNAASNARNLAADYDIESLTYHVPSLENMASRIEYFKDIEQVLAIRGVEAIFYAGFMKIATPAFCSTFPGVNVHPADLTIIGNDGIAKYRGMRALSDMRRDTGATRASVHVVDTPVDSGTVISLSRQLTPGPEKSDVEAHYALKAEEHRIYVETLRQLGKGGLRLDKIPYTNLSGESHV